jgi:hypothetical protein
MNWQQLDSLRADGVDERTLQDIARKHGLDMPHVPVLSRRPLPDAGVLQTFAVTCAGCSFKHGQPIYPCLVAPDEWTYPHELVNVRPVQQAVELALAAVRDEWPTADERWAG